MSKLKRCPCCDDKDATPFKPENAWHVRCPYCGLSTGWRATKSEAIAAWNHRTPSPRLRALEEALRDAGIALELLLEDYTEQEEDPRLERLKWCIA